MSYNTRPSVEIDQSIAFYDSGDSSKPQCGSDPVLKSTGQLKNPAVDLYYVKPGFHMIATIAEKRDRRSQRSCWFPYDRYDR